MKEDPKMTITEIAAWVSAASVLLGVLTTVIVFLFKVINGQRCLLRSEMLRIYYHHSDAKVIRQYEYENFVLLYEAYKKLRGNSFIDKIYAEVQTWKVIT